MKIEYNSRSSVVIEHNGRKARFFGDLGSVGFRAFASSMTWMLPHSRKEPATEAENKLLTN